MATVPTLRTWTDGEVITAAMLNANLRDPADFLANKKPHALARQLSTTTNIPNLAWTSLVFDFEDVDTDGGFVGSNPFYYTVQTQGYYLITGHVNFNNTSTAGARCARIGGSLPPTHTMNVINGAFECVPATHIATGVYVSAMGHFNVGDRFYLQAFQNSGITVPTNLNYADFRNETSYLDVAWMGKHHTAT